jgi:hypothetical protein
MKTGRPRKKLLEQVLHPVEFWIPDVESASFRAEARRQCKAVALSSRDRGDQDFIELISDFSD